MKNYYLWFLDAKSRINGCTTIEKFLEELGLFHQPSLYQDFPVDELLYISNETLLGEIRTSIDSLEKGYIFLKGGPGTGKSTFLQMEINQRSLSEIILFRYLCYRDDRTYTLTARGETEIFLKDLNGRFSNYLDDNEEILKDSAKKVLEMLRVKITVADNTLYLDTTNEALQEIIKKNKKIQYNV